MGNTNAAIPTPQPVCYTEMFGGHGLPFKHLYTLHIKIRLRDSIKREAWS